MTYDMHDRRMSSANEGMFSPTALILRKLPRNTTGEAVRTMLLFSKDLQDAEIVPNEYETDKGFATAIARFSTLTGASEAQAMLDGKPNTAGIANMIVEILPASAFLGSSIRRNTLDPTLARNISQTISPVAKSSRFNGTFQAIDSVSPPATSTSPEPALNGMSAHMQNIFTSQSPRHVNGADRSRNSGKLVIGEDGGDEDPDGLLNNPLAFMQKDSTALSGDARRSGPRVPPATAFNNLSINTSMTSPPPAQYGTPRSALPGQTPSTPFSPGAGQFHPGTNQFLRHKYPPANPADQNPPCNTLYVGNLPMDASEDELKAMFSKQRGYKRLCFRTKQNGPMCFVEFEDISFATKALHELYGAQLHNSVKGGIRLSFSKNPLGVRSGQMGGNASPAIPLNTAVPGMLNGMVPMSPGSFMTANGPPPGLSVPPGYSTPSNVMNGAFGLGVGGLPPPISRLSPSNHQSAPGSNGFTDYMLGR